MRSSRVKRKLAENEAVLMPQLHLTDPSVFEMTSLMGFDAIWMDLEHHPYSLETAANLMRAARVGSSDIMARPAKGEFMRLQRIFEAGAQGIMYPRCDNAAEAAEVVKWAKFAPMGKRGFDGSGPDVPYMSLSIEDYVERANQETFVIIQLEDQAAVNEAEAIARTPGVDGLILGIADFSILEGIPGQIHHKQVETATETVAAAAKKANIHWGRPSASAEETAKLLAMGAKLILHNADLNLVREGLERIKSNFYELGFRFD